MHGSPTVRKHNDLRIVFLTKQADALCLVYIYREAKKRRGLNGRYHFDQRHAVGQPYNQIYCFEDWPDAEAPVSLR